MTKKKRDVEKEVRADQGGCCRADEVDDSCRNGVLSKTSKIMSDVLFGCRFPLRNRVPHF